MHKINKTDSISKPETQFAFQKISSKNSFETALLKAELQSICVDEHFRDKNQIFKPQTTTPAVHQTVSMPVKSPDAPPLSIPTSPAPADPSAPSFIASLWPMAQKAAVLIGLDPKLLLAQVALETGWGKLMSKDSLNLFNIKAVNSSKNESVKVQTTEFYSGTAVKTTAVFKKYSSFEESFSDYISLISTGARYQPAIRQADDPESYVKALQSAGYATDPQYAEKIMDIYNGPRLNALLKNCPL